MWMIDGLFLYLKFFSTYQQNGCLARNRGVGHMPICRVFHWDVTHHLLVRPLGHQFVFGCQHSRRFGMHYGSHHCGYLRLFDAIFRLYSHCGALGCDHLCHDFHYWCGDFAPHLEIQKWVCLRIWSGFIYNTHSTLAEVDLVPYTLTFLVSLGWRTDMGLIIGTVTHLCILIYSSGSPKVAITKSQVSILFTLVNY